jgi:hypothetical protein
MARNSNLKLVAVKTEAALGRANSAAHKVAKAGVVARNRLTAISRHVKALKRQLQENTEGFKYALR